MLKDYSLRFDLWALCWVEPSFANLRHEEGAEVHGVAFKMTQEGMKKLDSQEGYSKRFVTLDAYDGRKLKGFIYINQRDKPDKPASKRYMGVLIKGAKAAGLKPEYVDKLKAMPTYNPPEFLIEMREGRGQLSDYKAISLEELSRHTKVEDNW